MSVTAKLLTAALLTLCAMLTEVSAGTISAFGVTSLPPGSTGLFGPVGVTPAPNNDNNAAASPNLISYNVFFNSLGNLDVEYVIANSGGTTEYRLAQTFFNNTGQVWTGFRFELGYGVGANFVSSSVADFLDFDAPDRDPAPTSSAFATLNHQADIINWTGGAVPTIRPIVFSFAFDVPDNLQSFNPGALNRFTLRQTPTIGPAAIPEPATMLLLGTGLAGTAAIARRKRRARHG